MILIPQATLSVPLAIVYYTTYSALVSDYHILSISQVEILKLVSCWDLKLKFWTALWNLRYLRKLRVLRPWLMMIPPSYNHLSFVNENMKWFGQSPNPHPGPLLNYGETDIVWFRLYKFVNDWNRLMSFKSRGGFYLQFKGKLFDHHLKGTNPGQPVAYPPPPQRPPR